MKTIIHVNQHNIRYNKNNEHIKPVLTCKTYKSNEYAYEVAIMDGDKEVGRFVYSPDKPLSCGAKVWFETNLKVEIIK